jgi:UDP-glucose 4-epimerase
VQDPVSTDRANTNGTLLVLKAAADAGARRVVAASSSSVYGGAEQLPTPESAPLVPRSPYAVSKLAGEHYCRVWHELFGLETVSLRYFNVYGPRQRPDSAYAAVIPLFIRALRAGERPVVHGDGLQSRSFAFIDDVVAANLAAAGAPAERCAGRAYNIAGSSSRTLLELLDELGAILGVAVVPEHTDPRAGDVRQSSADLTAAGRDLGWAPGVSLPDGLRRTADWFAAQDG